MPYPPQFYGGSQSSVQSFCLELNRRGYAPFLYCTLTPTGFFGFESRIRRRLLHSSYVVDQYCGYETLRSWNVIATAKEVANDINPDVVIAEAGKTMAVARKFVDLGLPTLASIRDVEFDQHGGDHFTHPRLRYFSNSSFTQARLKRTFGIDSCVIHPVVHGASYQTVKSGSYVLHINPHPIKGIETTLKLAQMRPDIRFLIIGSWSIASHIQKEFFERYRKLSNVEFRKPVRDMRKIYAGARCLIVPSVWEEAWCRAVTEAQISGTPVIASAVGGLPESVGQGGILVEPDASIDVWSAALASILDDPNHYRVISQTALQYAQREEIQPANIMNKFIDLIESHLETMNT